MNVVRADRAGQRERLPHELRLHVHGRPSVGLCGRRTHKALTEAVGSKSYDMLGDLEKRVSQLAADRAELEQAEATAGGDLVSAWPVGDRFCLAIRPTDFLFLL